MRLFKLYANIMHVYFIAEYIEYVEYIQTENWLVTDNTYNIRKKKKDINKY